MIGKVIQRIRQDIGMSRAELAEQCNLSRSAIFRIETGSREPKEDTILLIASALGVEVSKIYNSVIISLQEYEALLKNSSHD